MSIKEIKNSIYAITGLIVLFLPAVISENSTPQVAKASEFDIKGITSVDTSMVGKVNVYSLEEESQKPVEEKIEPKKEEIKGITIQKEEEFKATSVLPGLAEHYNTYKEYYKADSTCHPYIIAAIHYRETNFGNTNAWNGQGAFQNLRNNYAGGSEVTDWNDQVTQACLHLKGKVGVQTLGLDDIETLGTALAKYNGCAGRPWRQCSYVVNKSNLMAVGTKCAVDGCAYMTTDNRYGALTIIQNLKELNV
jgi:hypothetical protein